jgi:mRNA interferase RelE/StbE
LTWRVEWDERARKELRRLDQQAQRDILQYLRERIATDQDPRRFGKQLLREKWGLWRYRVGDYRLICSIEDDRFIVLVVKAGHRSKVYD